MEFRLLGSVEAYAAGMRIDLGPPKRRFLLAVLALDVNRPVSVARLVELTWPDSTPRTAEHAIQVSVSHLRKTLAGASDGAVTVLRQGQGYLLRTDATAIDAHRFRALLDRARGETDDRRKVALLDQALALWRGDPMACCAPPDVARSLCRGLKDARLAATEDWADARLRLGDHRALLDGLTDLVARHPLRERLAGQLMLALYRDGRAGEALATYRATRERLATELGLDPGPQLRWLEAAVLRDDPAIAAPGADPPTDPRRGGLRIVLVDDHPLFRGGIRTALETGTDITVVAEAGDVRRALEVVDATQPDLVIMDLHLPDGSGVDAARALIAKHPRLPILMMTMSGTDEHIVDALRAGARGYILKSAGRDEVLNAVRTIAHGGAVFSADVALRIAAMAAPPDGPGNSSVVSGQGLSSRPR